MQIRKDMWRCAILPAPLEQIVQRGTLAGLPLTWLPGTGNWRYLADPFGLWRDDRLHVFAEHFDYRDAIGRIVATVFDRDLNLLQQAEVLREDWHLSYPFVFEAEGETWMLPEAFQSNGLWLYRAVHFPWRWERVQAIPLDRVPLDATAFHDGTRWWLFYAPAFPAEQRLTHLHAAWADRLEGPWTPHGANPILVDPAGARPGGTPLWHDGSLHLPLQDCRGTYGAALRLLRFEHLEPGRIVTVPAGSLRAPPAATPFLDGCHTLSAAGPVTLIDVKQLRFSPRALTMRPMRDLRRAWHALARR
jgi:hypothetical protein